MTRSRVLAALLGGLLLVALTACGDDGEGRSADSATTVTPDMEDLVADPWVSTSVEGHELAPGSTLTLTFTDDTVTANAGCNTITGPANIDGDELVVDKPASTMMACEQPLSDQDVWVTTFISSRPTIELSGDELWLSKDDTVIHLEQSS